MEGVPYLSSFSFLDNNHCIWLTNFDREYNEVLPLYLMKSGNKVFIVKHDKKVTE